MRHTARLWVLSVLLMLLGLQSAAFGWGPEGHKVIALIAAQNMSATALQQARVILGGVSLEDVANWADYIRRERPDTARWHYIDIPLADSQIDLERECPHGACVVVKSEQYLAVLGDPRADRAAKAEALKFVVHFAGDMHQPLHCEDDGDKGGNTRRVIFHGHPDDLHWVWDSGLLDDINRNANSLTAELEQQITPEDRAAWDKGSIEDWVLEAHRLAQTVAYGDLGDRNPPLMGRYYERQADPVVELQLERAGVRLAYVLDQRLQ